MAAILMRWANGLGLSEHVERLEGQCANGYLIGEILERYGVVTKDELDGWFTNGDDLQTRADNFDRLEILMRERLGFDRVDSKLFSQVIMEEPGAIAKLLFDLKCKLSPDSAPPMAKTISLAEKNLKEKEQQALMKGKERIRHKPAPNKDIERAVRGKLTTKQLDLTLHLAKFDEERVEREKRVDRKVAKEEKRLVQEIEERRQQKVRRLRENREFLTEWMEQGKVQWRANENVKVDRVRRELKHELTCRTRDQALARKVRKDHTDEVITGTETFERNLKRLGLEDQQVEEEEQAALVKFIEEKRRGEHGDYKAIVKDAIASGKIDDEKYIMRLRAQKLENLEGQKKREQRRRKIMVDQQHAKRDVDKKLEDDQLMKVIATVAAQERELAQKHRRAQIEKEMETKRIHEQTQKMIADRDQAFREAVMQKRQEYKLSHQETMKHIADQRIAWEQKQEEKEKQKRVKHEIMAKETVELLVGAACRVIDCMYENETKELLRPDQWREIKQEFILGKTPITIPKDENERVPTPEDVIEDITVLETFDARLKETELLTNEALNLTEAPLQNLLSKLETLATTENIAIPCALPKRTGICVSQGDHSDMILARLKWRFGLTILSLKSYLIEVEENHQRLLAEEQKALEQAEAAGEQSARNDPKSKKKQPTQKALSTPMDLETFTTATRGELVDLVSKIENEEERTASLDLVRLIAHDITSLPEDRSAYVLYNLIQTKRQAQALEYLVRGDSSKTFDEFCKVQSDLNATPRLNSSVILWVHETFPEQQLDKSTQEISDWFQRYGKVLSIALTNPASTEEEVVEEEKDGDNEPTRKAEEEILSEFHSRFLKLLEPAQHDKALTEGEKMLLDHLEALEMPDGVGHRLNLDACKEIFQNWMEVQNRYRRRILMALNDELQVKQDIDNEVKLVVESGLALIRGEKCPPNLDTDPQSMKANVLENWSQDRHTLENISFNDVDNSIDTLGHHLWDITSGYSQVVQRILSDWQQENLAESWILGFITASAEMVEVEHEYYTSLRETIKSYYAQVEPPKAIEEDSEFTEPPSTPPEMPNLNIPAAVLKQTSEGEIFYNKTKQVLRSVSLREERESHSQESILSKQNSWLNQKLRVTINQITDRVLHIITDYPNQFTTSFQSLNAEIKRQIAQEDKHIREFVECLKLRMRTEANPNPHELFFGLTPEN